jgi:hypothetical protein
MHDAYWTFRASLDFACHVRLHTRHLGFIVLHCRATLDGLGVRRVDFFVATFAFRAYWIRHGAHSTLLSHWTRHEASLSSFAILDFLVTRHGHEAYCDLGHIGLGTRQSGLLLPYWTRRQVYLISRATLDISCVPHWTRHEAGLTSRACHIGLGTRHIGHLVRAILDSARGRLDFSCVRAILDSARGILDFSCVPYWTRHEAYWTSRACHIGLLASFEFGQILDPNLCNSCYLNLGLQREHIGPRTTTTTLDSSINIGLGAEPQPYDP